MIDTALISVAPGETRVALLADGETVEATHHRTGRESIVGRIYLGRVTSVVPNLQAAFLDLGLGRDGFLNANDARDDPDGEVDSIGRYVDEGEAVPVMVLRDGLADKGPRVTTRLALPGRFVVYLPDQRRTSVSRRIEDADERRRLTEIVGGAAQGDEGFTLRTAAEGADADDIVAEIAELRAVWAEVVQDLESAAPPACVYRGPDPVLRGLRDHVGLARVLIDSDALLARAKGYCDRHLPDLTLEAYRDSRPLFERFGVEAAIEQALEPRVELPSGGAIVIQRTEAMTTIDVDTGRATRGRDGAGAMLHANLEAAAEIARQLRLRAVGGVIVVDFVRMADADHRKRVLNALREALADDREAGAPFGFSRLGLVELRRRRSRPSLAEVLGEPCDVCIGTGWQKSAETIAIEAVRAAHDGAATAPPGALTLSLSPAVAEAFAAAELGLGEALAAMTGRQVMLDVDDERADEHPDIRYG